MKNLVVFATLFALAVPSASAQDKKNAKGDKAKAAKPKQVRKKRKRIDVSKIDLKKLAANAKDEPDEKGTITKFYIGYLRKIVSVIYTKPKAAKKLLKQMAADMKEIKPTKPAGKAALKRAKSYHARYMVRVVMMEKQAAMVGKPALPLKSQAWANGEALSKSDLKGKVVLLDFWAVWCGPCVRKFPTVRRWQRELGDKGLVVIGVTKRYNYRWDKEAKKHKRVSKDDETVPLKDEVEMLNHYAKQHKLNYKLLVSDKKASLSKGYHVFGIPTIAVIDQKGIIRYVGLSNDEKIEALLHKLLGVSKPAAGGE